MTDAQTEARAIVSAILVDERLAVGYQIETLADAIVEHIATALAAKNAELVEMERQREVERICKEHARRECERAEAQLAETRKALDDIATLDNNSLHYGPEFARRALEAQGGENAE